MCLHSGRAHPLETCGGRPVWFGHSVGSPKGQRCALCPFGSHSLNSLSHKASHLPCPPALPHHLILAAHNPAVRTYVRRGATPRARSPASNAPSSRARTNRRLWTSTARASSKSGWAPPSASSRRCSTKRCLAPPRRTAGTATTTTNKRTPTTRLRTPTAALSPRRWAHPRAAGTRRRCGWSATACMRSCWRATTSCTRSRPTRRRTWRRRCFRWVWVCVCPSLRCGCT